MFLTLPANSTVQSSSLVIFRLMLFLWAVCQQTINTAVLGIHYKYFINKLFSRHVHSIYHILFSLPHGNFFLKILHAANLYIYQRLWLYVAFHTVILWQKIKEVKAININKNSR